MSAEESCKKCYP